VFNNLQRLPKLPLKNYLLTCILSATTPLDEVVILPANIAKCTLDTGENTIAEVMTALVINDLNRLQKLWLKNCLLTFVLSEMTTAGELKA